MTQGKLQGEKRSRAENGGEVGKREEGRERECLFVSGSVSGQVSVYVNNNNNNYNNNNKKKKNHNSGFCEALFLFRMT